MKEPLLSRNDTTHSECAADKVSGGTALGQTTLEDLLEDEVDLYPTPIVLLDLDQVHLYRPIQDD